MQMKAYCSFCGEESGPFVGAPLGTAKICEDCARCCIVLFKQNQRPPENGRAANLQNLH